MLLEYVGERTEWVCYRILTSLYMLVALVIVSGMRRYTGGAGVSACGTVAKPEMSSGCFTWRGNVDRVLDWHDM